MLDFNEFVEEIRSRITDYLLLCDIESVEIKQVLKNNGVVETGLLVRLKDYPVTPNIYLEDYYERYRKGVSVEKILADITESYLYARSRFAVSTYELPDADAVKSALYCRLVNRSTNEKLLEETPYIPYLDLAVTFRYVVTNDQDKIGSVSVKYREMEQWGFNKEQLFMIARENMRKLFPIRLIPLQTVIREMLGDEAELGLLENAEGSLYILTNEQGINGASCIIYEDILEEFAREHDSSFYILPSSIHEILLLPETKDTDLEVLSNTVSSVNRTAVQRAEYLSDSVYYYDRNTKSVSICELNT